MLLTVLEGPGASASSQFFMKHIPMLLSKEKAWQARWLVHAAQQSLREAPLVVWAEAREGTGGRGDKSQ